ncbi:MAG: Rpn family recombination-promoting nuclease/putative transposase [Methanobrevibacter sp.]|jgi:predicted transposase/invertase (TIGR01784 family)|nr:Rpn family recombination-promoting nuclease/putative transposase [Candidatus Methanovirga basalitermitum]
MGEVRNFKSPKTMPFLQSHKNNNWRIFIMRSFSPLDDYLFSQYMASKGMENQLKSFINSVIMENNDIVVSIDIIANKLIAGEIKGKKNCILDLRSVASDGRHFIVEVQRQNQYYFKKRSLLYLAREYSNSAKKGKIEDLRAHVLINILDFDFCKNDIANQKFNITGNIDNCLYSDYLTIYNINIQAFRKMKKDLNNPLHRWMIFFDNKSSDELINEVIEMDEDIKLADKKFNELLSDDEAFHDYQMRQLAKMEFEGELSHSKEEGIKEGELKGKMETAISLLRKGFDLNLVSEVTNLPTSKLKDLKY